VMAPDVRPSVLAEALGGSVPLVLINATDADHHGVTIDNYGGARAMTRHLLALGHSRIAFLRGPEQNSDARERLRGYRQVMRQVNRPRLELPGDFTERSGAAAAARILESDERPTAIFAANDSMAVGALSTLAEAGVDVPGEIAVAGFDDIPIARYVTPPLTTVGVDTLDLGRRAFAMLLEAIADPEHEPRCERVGATLVIRRSCGAFARQQETSMQPNRKLRGQRKGEKA
jgi:LacI family transcriptional regulator